MKPKRDYGLILSLGIIISVGSYWFVKEMPTNGIEFYLDALGDKLTAMVPQDNEKEALAAVYDDFKEKVKDKKIKPEKVEKMAAAIINLSNSKDTLNISETEALIEIASTSIGEPSSPEILYEKPSTEDWERLNERLGAVHELDEKLREQNIIINREPEMAYRVDENLNVILDSRVRKTLEKEKVLHRLEKQESIVWIDNMAESFKEDLKRIEIEMEALGEEHDARKSMLKLRILTQPIIEKGMMIIDSLNITTIINWDSLEGEIVRGIESEHEDKERILKEFTPETEVKN